MDKKSGEIGIHGCYVKLRTSHNCVYLRVKKDEIIVRKERIIVKLIRLHINNKRYNKKSRRH